MNPMASIEKDCDNMADFLIDDNNNATNIAGNDISNIYMNLKNNYEINAIISADFLQEIVNTYTVNRTSELINYIIDHKSSPKMRCRHCNSSNVILFGKARGKQRHMCKECGRTFTILTNTPLSGTHYPEKWREYIECMLKGMSLHESESKVKVSYVTLFYWRHKILSILKNIKPKEMNGIVELDDIYLNYSEKGQKKGGSHKRNFEKKERIHRKSDSFLNFEGDKVCVLAAADRFSNVFSKIACIGRLGSEEIDETVGKLISEKNQVYFKHRAAYYSFSNKRHIKRYTQSLDRIKPANSYLIKCMKWMHRFKGVATTYLNNYLGWYKFLFDINFDKTQVGARRLLEAICI